MPLVELQLQDLQVVHLQALGTQVELQLVRGYPKCMNDILIKKKKRPSKAISCKNQTTD